jgi:hypothetical protein
MGVVAVVVDGVWTPVDDGRPPPVNPKTDTYVIDPSTSDVDRIVAHLGQVVRLAQNLSETDARRVRDFVHAASSMLSATTYLPAKDQAQFERALRDR